MRRVNLLLSLILGITFLLPTPSYSGTRDPNTPDTKYLVYGAKFNCVARVQAVYPRKTGRTTAFASAVLIRPNWAITAAHVLHESNEAALMLDDGRTVPVAKQIIHADYTPEPQILGLHDIALCYIADDMKLAFYPELYKDFDEQDQICSLAGYGSNGTFLTGPNADDEKRRAGSNKVELARGPALILTPSQQNRTELEYLICSGDSGGGLFLGNKLAGIHSFVMCEIGKKPDSRYHTESGHTRVSLYYDWINAQIELHELTIQSRLTLSPTLPTLEK